MGKVTKNMGETLAEFVRSDNLSYDNLRWLCAKHKLNKFEIKKVVNMYNIVFHEEQSKIKNNSNNVVLFRKGAN